MELGGRPIQKKIIRRAAALVFLPMAVFLLSGCQLGPVPERLKEFDKALGRVVDGGDIQQNDLLKIIMEKKEESRVVATTTKIDLNDEQKAAIDEWLEERGLNRYGDDKKAFYKGGTPLFDPDTGKSIDRYDYILFRYPNLLSELK